MKIIHRAIHFIINLAVFNTINPHPMASTTVNPKAIWKEVQELLANLKTTIDPSKPFDPAEVVKKWKQIWTPVRKVLEYAKAMKLTGDRADKKLDEIIALGDKVADPATLQSFLAAIKKVWKIVRVVLVPLSHTGKPEFQAAVQKFITILDWLTAAA